MEQPQYKSLFKQIIKKKHGVEVNFEIVENKLEHLKGGGILSYHHLEIIADDRYWPFRKYWMWPCKEQIEKELLQTDNWFLKLENSPEEENVYIDRLDAIFKNLSLVSIVLRFIFPTRYAIYSRPTLKILRIERGANDVEEYLNYIRELRILRQSFGVTKTSDMDMIVWAISKEKGSYLEELKKILAEQLPENLTPSELLIYLSSEPIKIAKCYFEKKAFKISGFWSARAFEQFLYDECKNYFGYIPISENGELWTIIKNICKTKKFRGKENLLHKLRKLRNKAIHVTSEFSKDEANSFLKLMNRLYDLD